MATTQPYRLQGIDPKSRITGANAWAQIDQGQGLSFDQRDQAMSFLNYTDTTGASEIGGSDWNRLAEESARMFGGTFEAWQPQQAPVAPVDPRPQSESDNHWIAGTAAGQDMSWMNQPGGTTYAGATPPGAFGTPGAAAPPNYGNPIAQEYQNFIAANQNPDGTHDGHRFAEAYGYTPGQVAAALAGGTGGNEVLAGPPQPAITPGGPSQEQITDFLARNPGDEHRITEAFADDNLPKPGALPPDTTPPPAPPAGPAVAPAPGPAAAPGNTAGPLTLPDPLTAPNPFVVKPFAGSKFTAPGRAAAENDPGYQFALTQGLNAIKARNAAQGDLFTGGTMKGLIDYATNAASSQYDKVYDREFAEFGDEDDRAYREWLATNGLEGEAADRNFNYSTGVYDRGVDRSVLKDKAYRDDRDYDFSRERYGGDTAFRDRAYAGDTAYRDRAFDFGVEESEDARAHRDTVFDFGKEVWGDETAFRDRSYESGETRWAAEFEQRTKEFTSSDEFRRYVVGSDDEWRRYRATIDDAWKREVADEQRDQFLAELGTR